MTRHCSRQTGPRLMHSAFSWEIPFTSLNSSHSPFSKSRLYFWRTFYLLWPNYISLLQSLLYYHISSTAL